MKENSKLPTIVRLTALIATVTLPLTTVSAASPVGVDGALGAEWSGITPASVTYNAAAPVGNFGTPGTENHVVAYDIYARADASYVYGLFLASPAVDAAPVNFVNLYLDTNPFVVSGSDVGFELLNDRAFKPGVPGYYTGLSTLGMVLAQVTGGIEFAMPWSYFLTDPQGIGFPTLSGANNDLRFQLSQSFGYSVAGGAAGYGTARLGLVEVPETGTLGACSAFAAFAAGLGAYRMRRKH